MTKSYYLYLYLYLCPCKYFLSPLTYPLPLLPLPLSFSLYPSLLPSPSSCTALFGLKADTEAHNALLHATARSKQVRPCSFFIPLYFIPLFPYSATPFFLPCSFYLSFFLLCSRQQLLPCLCCRPWRALGVSPMQVHIHAHALPLSYTHMSYSVLSCPVLSCPVLSCPVLSCPALPLHLYMLYPYTSNMHLHLQYVLHWCSCLYQ